MDRGRIRIKCTDELHRNNVSYVVIRNRTVYCTLANGIPASLWYAGIRGDLMAAQFELEDATSAQDAVRVMEKYGKRYSYQAV